MRKSDLLRPVSVADRVSILHFSVSQVCLIADVTKMQLDYWTERARIPTQGQKQRLYDCDSVEFVMLIKQARDIGFDVNAAIDAAAEFRSRRLKRTRRVAA